MIKNVTIQIGEMTITADVTVATMHNVLDAFMSASTVVEKQAAVKRVIKPVPAKPASKPTPQPPRKTERAKVKQEADAVVKIVPKIGEEHTLTASIGETLALALDTVKPLKKEVVNTESPVIAKKSEEATGDVRETSDGEMLYRADYWCPCCGTESKRYTRKENKYVKCHNCNHKIEMESAVPGSTELAADRNGAFFIARETYRFPTHS